MPSSVWGISCFVIALLVSTAHAEYPDLMNRYQDQLRVQREGENTESKDRSEEGKRKQTAA